MSHHEVNNEVTNVLYVSSTILKFHEELHNLGVACNIPHLPWLAMYANGQHHLKTAFGSSSGCTARALKKSSTSNLCALS